MRRPKYARRRNMDTTWSNTTRILVILFSLAGAIWLIVIAGPLVEALIIAALLAYLLNPAVCWLARRSGLSRSHAVAFIFVVTILIILAIPAALGTVAFSSIGFFGRDLMSATEEIQEWFLQPVDILGFRLQPQQMLEPLQGIGASLLATLPGGSLNILSSVTTNLLWAVTVLVMYYYLLKDGHKIKPWLVTLAPQSYRPELERLLQKIDHVWGKFLRIQLIMFFVIFLLMVVGTLLIVGLFRFGLLRWSPLGFIALLVLLYTAIQQLDNLWIRPHILGKQMRLHPGLVFAGLIGALMVSGLLGALLVVPLLATGKVAGRYVHRKMLGLAPWPDDASATENVEEAERPSPVTQEEERVYPI